MLKGKIRKGIVVACIAASTLCMAVSAQAAVKISRTSAVTTVGKTFALKVTGTKGKVTWKSSNSKIASVSSAGKVKGRKAGKTTITAKVSGKTLKCSVTVKKKPVEATPKYIASYLKKAGYSNAAVLGIMGNLQIESGLNQIMREGKWNNLKACKTYAENIRNGKVSKKQFILEGVGKQAWHKYSEGYGLAQWTTVDLANPNADRKAGLWDYATSIYSDVTDCDAQLGFMLKEMKARGFGPGWMKNSTDVSKAVRDFMLKYEGGNIMLNARINAAKTLKSQLKL